MGTGSSIEARNKEENTQKLTQKDLREQMVKEFGKVANKDSENNNLITNENIPDDVGVKMDQKSINPAIFKAKGLFMKPIMKSRPKEKNLVIKKQINGTLLKEMYRRMDPSVSHLSMRSIVGEIEVAVKYKVSEQMLLVKIGRAKGLHQKDLQSTNPYVSVSLFENNNIENALTSQTKVKTNTCNPVFQEILVFQLTEMNVASSSLQISVWDKIEISQDEFLGQALVELCRLNLNTGNILWFKLQPQADTAISGNMDITMAFDLSTSVLTVTVHQASGLKIGDEKNGTSHPFFRMHVTGIPSKAESEVINNSLDPVWDADHDFGVHKDEFSRRILIINMLSKNKRGHMVRLGDVHIPLVNIDVNEWGDRKTYELQDLRNTAYSRSKWSEEGVSMEFKEAMKAHAIYGYPKFLFKKEHVGRKIVSCYSKKAKTQAKMIISNGVPTLDEIQM